MYYVVNTDKTFEQVCSDLESEVKNLQFGVLHVHDLGKTLRSKGVDFKEHLNPDSLEVVTHSMVEPYLKNAKPGEQFQFERLGYFCVDCKDSSEAHLVFNRTVTLRDSWAKIEKRGNN